MNKDEAVARAMCKAFCTPNEDDPCDCSQWEVHGIETHAAIAAHEKWLADNGLMIVPVEPTEAMLTNSGPMEGFDRDLFNDAADRCHTEWWKAMIAAAKDGE